MDNEEYLDVVRDSLEELFPNADDFFCGDVKFELKGRFNVSLLDELSRRLVNFNEDQWRLLELVAGFLWEANEGKNLPDAELVSKLTLYIFRQGNLSELA